MMCGVRGVSSINPGISLDFYIPGYPGISLLLLLLLLLLYLVHIET